METYEDVVRRIEPKNYTVKWRMADGKTESAYSFPSYAEAYLHASLVKARNYVVDVQILRAGRHPSSKKWTPSRRSTRVHQARNVGIFVHEEAWALPAGFVDGDADRHGPVVHIPIFDRPKVRTDREKAEWFEKNRWDDRTCLWM